MKTTYSILFTVELLHDFYADRLCKDFEISSAAETFYLFNNHKVLTRVFDNQLIALTETDAGKPKIEPAEGTIYRLYLTCKKQHFGNYTNIDLAKGQGTVYYFTNLSANAVGGVNYLSQQVSLYAASTDYVPGDLASNAAGNIFEALQNNGPATAVHSTGDPGFWKNTGTLQYVTAGDLIKKINSIYNFQLNAPASAATVKVSGYNIATGNYDKEIISEIRNYDSPQTSIQINAGVLQPGKYKISVNGDDEFVYYDPQLFSKPVFGVIEIHHNNHLSTEFQLLDAAGLIREVAYTIHFRNRSTIWKYIAKTADVTAVNDSSLAFSFSNGGSQQFISDQPVPLTETPFTTISIQSATLGSVNSIKNPNVRQVKQLIRSGSTYYCSEIFINY